MNTPQAQLLTTLHKTPKTMEQSLQAAIETRINQIADEEIQKTMERIRSRIVADCVGLAPLILKNTGFGFGDGDITIHFKSR